MRLVGVCPAAATPAALINPPKNSRRLDTVHLDSKNRSPFYSAAAAKGTGRYGSQRFRNRARKFRQGLCRHGDPGICASGKVLVEEFWSAKGRKGGIGHTTTYG